MQTVSVKLPDDLLEEIEERVDQEDYSTRSDAIRDLLRDGLERDRLETEIERLETRIEAILSRQDDVEDLVRYVDQERSLRERRERLRIERETAGVATRLRWWLFGRDLEPRDDQEP